VGSSRLVVAILQNTGFHSAAMLPSLCRSILSILEKTHGSLITLQETKLHLSLHYDGRSGFQVTFLYKAHLVLSNAHFTHILFNVHQSKMTRYEMLMIFKPLARVSKLCHLTSASVLSYRKAYVRRYEEYVPC